MDERRTWSRDGDNFRVEFTERGDSLLSCRAEVPTDLREVLPEPHELLVIVPPNGYVSGRFYVRELTPVPGLYMNASVESTGPLEMVLPHDAPDWLQKWKR